ncbi:hypothetical protein D9M68_898680 [compost metagenome]
MLIHHRCQPQCLVGLLASCHVHIGPAHAHWRAVDVSDDVAACKYRNIVSGFVAHAKFHLEYGFPACQRLVQHRFGMSDIFPMYKPPPQHRVGRQRVGQVAEHGPPARRVADAVAIQVPIPPAIV